MNKSKDIYTQYSKGQLSSLSAIGGLLVEVLYKLSTYLDIDTEPEVKQDIQQRENPREVSPSDFKYLIGKSLFAQKGINSSGKDTHWGVGIGQITEVGIEKDSNGKKVLRVRFDGLKNKWGNTVGSGFMVSKYPMDDTLYSYIPKNKSNEN